MFSRYAVYYAPAAESVLARLGADWLGRDAEAGPVAQHAPDLPGCRPMAELTASARRYGLHGTLKPPMRLGAGYSADDLIETAAAWAAGHPPVQIGALRVAAIGRFLALTPEEPPQPLNEFAADVVRAFERFRAPPTEAELARRRAQGLTPRQEQLLDLWGYPYVMDEFRFHVTLTDALEPHEAEPVRRAAEAHFAPVVGKAETMTDLAVFGEDEAGVFHLLTRLPLRG